SVSTTSGTSNSLSFTVTSPASLAAPSIASLSQTTAAAGGPAITLTVTGTNILPCSVVQWTNSSNVTTALTTTYVSGTQLSATVPAANFQAPGSAQVSVVTPALGGGTSGTLPFTILPPAITSLSSSVTSTASTPACGSTTFTLTVNGTNFVN